MKKFWFLETIFEKSKMRARVLPGQTYAGPGGVEIMVNSDLNCQSDKRVRAVYEVRTVFGTESLTLSSDGTFYVAGAIYPLTNLRGDEVLPEDMLAAYGSFKTADPITTPPVYTASVDLGKPVGKPRLSYLDSLRTKKHLQPPTPEDGFYVPEDVWWLLIRNIENNVPTMLIGPTGSGKTEVVNFIRQRLELDMMMHDMGAMVDPIANLLGVHRLKDGKSIFDYSKFSEDIQKPGILLLDEASRAPGGTNNVLFSLLDFRKYLDFGVAGHDDERRIPLNEDCVIFATANVGAEYTGTQTMDRALIDRFFPVELDYMPSAIEARLLVTRCDIALVDATIIAKVASSVRSLAKKKDLSSAVSTRHTLQAADLVKDGFAVQTALRLVFLPLFEGSDTEGERLTVLNCITAR